MASLEVKWMTLATFVPHRRAVEPLAAAWYNDVPPAHPRRPNPLPPLLAKKAVPFMKIARIETFPVEIPIKPERRIKSSLGEHVTSRYVLVRVLTDDGLEGCGEATVMPRWSGETVWGAVAMIDRVLAPAVLG